MWTGAAAASGALATVGGGATAGIGFGMLFGGTIEVAAFGYAVPAIYLSLAALGGGLAVGGAAAAVAAVCGIRALIGK